MRERKTYVFLLLGLLLLGPLAAVSAAYMNFKLGFFLGGSILTGVLGSVVSLWYGSDGRHGANYIQTLASAMGSLGGMSTILQAAAWLGLPQPSIWAMIVFLFCAGMYGIAVGSLTTPLLVDKWKLEFPSGRAVADMLRALTDPALLRRSVRGLGGGTLVGFCSALPALSRPLATIPGFAHFSAAVPGAGLIVGARIGLPAVVLAALGWAAEPWLESTGRLSAGSAFRSIGYLFALAMIVGAALVHTVPLLLSSIARLLVSRPGGGKEAGGNSPAMWLLAGLAAFCTAACLLLLSVPPAASALVVMLVPMFIVSNGISTGISDLNPISSAFVLSVAAAALVGALEPMAMLLGGATVLVACSVGVDMQQDRSTGARLGSDRNLQFVFQACGVGAGALLAPLVALFFFQGFPELLLFPPAPGWESAMTLKLAGTIRTVRRMSPVQLEALVAGFALGVLLALVRRFARRVGPEGIPTFSSNRTADFLLDAIICPTPFALSFGGFVSFGTAAWFALGSVVRSLWEEATARRQSEGAAGAPGAGDGSAEMGGPSLVGGGLIAGETLAYVALGLVLLAGQAR